MSNEALDTDKSADSSERWTEVLCSLFPSVVRILSLDVTPDRVYKIFLNFLWFVFITMVIGQLGPVLAAGIAFWEDRNVWDAIRSQANSGNLLTFSVALLAGSGYFMVKEFHDEDGFKFTYLKSPLLLLSIITGFAGALVSASLTKTTASEMTGQQFFWHWVLYFLCITLSIFWWALETGQDSLSKYNQEVKAQAAALTVRSNKPSSQPKTRIKV